MQRPPPTSKSPSGVEAVDKIAAKQALNDYFQYTLYGLNLS